MADQMCPELFRRFLGGVSLRLAEGVLKEVFELAIQAAEIVVRPALELLKRLGVEA